MRGLGALLLLATAVAAQAMPKKASLRPIQLKYELRRNYALPVGVEAAAKPHVRQGRLGRDVTYFIDVDGNGKFNDWGIDGWSLSKMPYVLPLEKTTIIGVSNITWDVAEDGKYVRYRLTPLGITPAQRHILIQFNLWRMMNGLPAVTVDQELSIACTKHCEYMERNGFDHREEEGKSGYTPEGAKAGRRSCLSEMNPWTSVVMFYSTFYHRLPLIDPATRAIGIGKSKRYSAMDGLTRREERAWRYPIIIPAPNTFHHPTHFALEIPSPHPDDMKPGFPITMTFRSGAITEVRARLWRKFSKAQRKQQKKGEKQEEEEISVLVSWPGQPANPTRPDNRNSVCIIPREPLRPQGDYRVHVTYKLDGEPRDRRWVFRTGPAGPGPMLQR
ncbi:MAG: CAP domain-containing protein [Planctomycetota bacterium]|jgi:hypothetical protein